MFNEMFKPKDPYFLYKPQMARKKSAIINCRYNKWPSGNKEKAPMNLTYFQKRKTVRNQSSFSLRPFSTSHIVTMKKSGSNESFNKTYNSCFFINHSKSSKKIKIQKHPPNFSTANGNISLASINMNISEDFLHSNDNMSFAPVFNQGTDREIINAELVKVLTELNKKEKEIDLLNTLYNNVEYENYQIMTKINILLDTCQIYKSCVNSENKMDKLHEHHDILIANLTKTHRKIAKDYDAKEKELEDLKSNDAKVLRLFDLDSKIAEKEEQLNKVSDKFHNKKKSVKDINGIVKLNKNKLMEIERENQEIQEINNKLKKINKREQESIKIKEDSGENLKKNMDILEKEISNLKTTLEEKLNTIKDLEEDIKKDKEYTDFYLFSSISSTVNNIRLDNERLSNKIKILRKEIDESNKALNDQKDQDIIDIGNHNVLIKNLGEEKICKMKELDKIQKDNLEKMKILMERQNRYKQNLLNYG